MAEFVQRRASAVAGICLFLATSLVMADDFKLDLGGSKKPGATISATVHAVAGEADQFDLSLEVRVPEDSYIYGVEGDFGGRTIITIESAEVEAISPAFSPTKPAKKEHSPDFNTDVYKHPKGATWVRRYRKTSADATVVNGYLEGQFCNNDSCVPIRKQKFEVSLAKLSEALPETSTSAPSPSPSKEPRILQFTERPKNMKGAPGPMELTFRLTEGAHVGDEVTLSIHATVHDGYYTYSTTMPENGGGTPTSLSVIQLSGLKPIDASFSADRPFKEQTVLGRVQQKFEEVIWSRRFQVTSPDYGVAGKIRYQLCNSNGCLLPKTVDFRLPIGLPVVEADTVQEEVNHTEKVDQAVAALDQQVQAAQPAQQGLLPFIVTAVVAGYLALLTPCVFPMIPITVSIFLKQHEKNHKSTLLLALVYCGTIILAFTVLGLGIAAIFGATQVNALANNAWINLFISAIFFVFALNMLGMFEIQIPSWLLTFTSSKEAAGGYLGVVFMALTFTLTSFTCTFAFVGSLLVAAANGGRLGPVIGMLAFGTAFASPFFFLALVPRLLHSLPKSGGWMNSVKVVLGLMELGLVVKFLSVADIGLNAQPTVLDYTLVMLLWFVLSIAIGIYLLGYIRFSHDMPMDYVPVPRALLAFAFFGLACLLAVGILNPDHAGGGWVMEQIQAFAPPRLDQDVGGDQLGANHNGANGEAERWEIPGPSVSHHGIRFALELDQAVPVAMANQQPVFIDITGVNCINCRQMETKMAKPANRTRLAQLVRVALYTDTIPKVEDAALAEQLLKQNRALQVNWFGDASLPSYVITTPDGKEILASFKGLETRSGDFTRFLDDGLSKFAAWKQRQAPAVSKSGK